MFAKLEHYGIRGTALQWIKSYFSKRPQFVQFNETQSSMLTIKCGVPQGSILGPLFFIVYINDLANASKVTESLLFADDTSIFYSRADIDHLVHVLNEELNNIDIWMKCNKLSINTKKTNYIIFKHKQKKIHRNTHLYFDDQLLERADTTKFLGVYIDENLNWKSHIGHVCNKIAKSVGIIFKSRFLLSAKTKLSLYYSLIYPYLSYCNVAWSSTYITNLNRIFLLQKRVVRAMTNSDFLAHTAPLFARLRILDIFKVNSFYIAKFMFSYHHALLPLSFRNLFVTNSQVHNYNTRSTANYRTHFCRTNIKQFSILYQGPKIWNSLPVNVKISNSLSCFKKRINDLLLN